MELNIVATLGAIIGTLIAVLIGLLAWIGNRVHDRLDSIASSLTSIEKDLRGDLVNLDRRVSKLEDYKSWSQEQDKKNRKEFTD